MKIPGGGGGVVEVVGIPEGKLKIEEKTCKFDWKSRGVNFKKSISSTGGKLQFLSGKSPSFEFSNYSFLESHSPAPTPEPSILKSVGRKHPLSSTGYENEMMSNASLSGVNTGGTGGEIDLDEMSNDEVLMEESLKAGQFDHYKNTSLIKNNIIYFFIIMLIK